VKGNEHLLFSVVAVHVAMTDKERVLAGGTQQSVLQGADFVVQKTLALAGRDV
jgi:hypothetical protein